MANPWPISPLTEKDIGFAVVNYDFSGLTADSLSELPGIEDAIDASLADFAASIADQTSLIAVLFDGLDDFGTILGEIDSSPLDGVLGELANTASAGDAILSDYQGMLTGTTSGGGSGGSGGNTAPSSNCSDRTNQYGLSQTGNFPGVVCDWKLTFQVIRVQDGPCTYSAAPGAQPGATTLPKITSFILQTGDTGVWTLGHHTEHASDGTPFDVIDVTVKPETTGHFDGTALLSLSNPNRTMHVCLSVDFIP